MELIEFRRALRRFWVGSLVCALAVFAVGMLTVAQKGRTYSATSTVLLTPRPNAFENASASVLRVILPNIVARVQSREIRSRVRKDVPASLRGVPITVEANMSADDGVLSVTASSTSPEAAVLWSRALANAIVTKTDNDKYLVAESLDPAVSPTSVRTVQITGLGGSFLLALLTFVLVAFAAERIRDSRDVATALRRRGVRVLATVRGSQKLDRSTRASLLEIAASLEPGLAASSPRIIFTGLSADGLAGWVAEGLADVSMDLDGDAPINWEASNGEYRSNGRTRALVIEHGPRANALFELTALARTDGVCVVVADEGLSSIEEIMIAVAGLTGAGIRHGGVVLVRTNGRFRRFVKSSAWSGPPQARVPSGV